MKSIWFDMDGTLYELYKIPNWLERLEQGDMSVFEDGKARAHLKRINRAIEGLVKQGWRVGVITWAPKNITPRLFAWANDVKFNWIVENCPALANSFACIPYGESKAQFLQDMEAEGAELNILVDDNKEVRAEWRTHGKTFKTINASKSFYRTLEGLLG